MNKQIKLLAEQAGFTKCKFYDGDEYLDKPITPISSISIDSELGKFAELIVRECVEEVMTYQHHRNSTREMVPFMVEDIKLHFGVE